MGICRRNSSHGFVRLASDDMSFRCFFRRRAIGLASCGGVVGAGLHALLPKCRNDDRHAANHRCAAAANQLQRFLRADDHVWSGFGEQRLDSSQYSCVTTLGIARPVRTRCGEDQSWRNDLLRRRPACRVGREMETDYKVKLEVFEGPLDLLLYLIKQDEIDIHDISLERITSQYLEYLQAFKELNIELAGEFIVMAANLIYLKSRSLLPLDQRPPEEDAGEEDPRWELIRQLIEYKKFKEAAVDLHLRELEQERIFPREAASSLATQEPLRLGEVGIFQLINAFQTVIKRIEARQDVQEIFSERFSVSEKIDAILRHVASGNRIRFSDLFETVVSRVEVVVTFLALLELIRLKQVRAVQKNIFEEIEILA